jgi:hypothetical protein
MNDTGSDAPWCGGFLILIPKASTIKRSRSTEFCSVDGDNCLRAAETIAWFYLKNLFRQLRACEKSYVAQ